MEKVMKKSICQKKSPHCLNSFVKLADANFRRFNRHRCFRDIFMISQVTLSCKDNPVIRRYIDSRLMKSSFRYKEAQDCKVFENKHLTVSWNQYLFHTRQKKLSLAISSDCCLFHVNLFLVMKGSAKINHRYARSFGCMNRCDVMTTYIIMKKISLCFGR